MLLVCAALTVGSIAVGGGAAWAKTTTPASAPISANAPEGFEVLLRPQTTLVDVYYGGRRLGEAMADYSPGVIRFASPEALIAMIPKLLRKDVVSGTLETDLPSNADRACDDLASGKCGRLSPEIIGVIFDEARFRAEVFVNPAYLSVSSPLDKKYLSASDAGPSLTGTLGGVVSGSGKAGAEYNLQASVLMAVGSAHIAAEVSQSSTVGTQVDTLAAVLDRGPLRYQAGLLWSPGLDLIGQGRFYGGALSTQVDTLLNRDQVIANPVLIYLASKSQVDILRNGRLISSQTFEAGNQRIDTSALPDGAYTVILRIHEAGGYTHEEIRSVNKTRSIPPLGLPQFFVAGGVLAEDYAAGLPKAGGAFLEAGYARRLSLSTAVDATAVLVDRQGLVELGANYMNSNGFRLRAAAMASTDRGAALLFSSVFNIASSSVLSLDVRQGWAVRESSSLFSAPEFASASSKTPVLTAALLDAALHQSAFGVGLDGTQFAATYTVAWRGGQYGFVSSYTVSPRARGSYTFGPTMDVPVRIANVDTRFVANVTDTEHGLQAFFGIRLMFNSGRRAVYGQAGLASTVDAQGRRSEGPSVNLTGSISGDTPIGGETAAASFTDTQDRATVSATGHLRGDYGDFTAEMDQDLSGMNPQTRYSAGFMIGAALTPSRSAVGSAAGGTSGVIVDVRGAPPGAQFQVLVNDAPRALIRVGESLPIMLPAYRTYEIRLSPKSEMALDFDTSARSVSLYPGNVRVLTWTADRIINVFGRVLDANGQPVAQAAIEGGKYPSVTDDNGYFQVDVTANGALKFERASRGVCQIAIDGVTAKTTHLSLGAQTCRTLMVAGAPNPIKLAAISMPEG